MAVRRSSPFPVRRQFWLAKAHTFTVTLPFSGQIYRPRYLVCCYAIVQLAKHGMLEHSLNKDLPMYVDRGIITKISTEFISSRSRRK